MYMPFNWIPDNKQSGSVQTAEYGGFNLRVQRSPDRPIGPAIATLFEGSINGIVCEQGPTPMTVRGLLEKIVRARIAQKDGAQR